MSFSDRINEFWEPGGGYGVKPPLDADTIDAAERQLGVKLPESLLAVLRIQHGGTVASAFRRFPVDGIPGNPEGAPFTTVSGLTEDDPTVLDSAYLIEEWELPEGLVLLDGEGHWWVGLDYRQPGEPSVVYVDDDGTDLTLAPSFEAFVLGLELELE